MSLFVFLVVPETVSGLEVMPDEEVYVSFNVSNNYWEI